MVNLVVLHGFWGDPEECKIFTDTVKAKNLWAPDLFRQGFLDPTHGFGEWAANFASEIRRRFEPPVTLAGYSMGGRLALHAVINFPELFDNVLLVSTHPGQLEDAERLDRMEWIEKWRAKFAKEEWAQLASDWEQQEVFGFDQPTARREVDRWLLVNALENWSLIRHEFDWEDLRKLKIAPIWAFGALDHKFLAVKERLERQNVRGRYHTLDNVGHRLMMDAGPALAKLLNEDSHG